MFLVKDWVKKNSIVESQSIICFAFFETFFFHLEKLTTIAYLLKTQIKTLLIIPIGNR